ncbi:MAG: hypothetical protein GEV05_06880 [Betaproteobacteria bacterium]|nr:hypothetical protein [Betaproteobacteria bacterium]
MRTESFSKPESTGCKTPRSGIGSADFLLLEARTAEAYLDMAQRSFDDEVQRRSVSRARRALTAMTYFLAESAGGDEDAQLIRRVRDDLRARLNKMTR